MVYKTKILSNFNFAAILCIGPYQRTYIKLQKQQNGAQRICLWLGCCALLNVLHKMVEIELIDVILIS